MYIIPAIDLIDGKCVRLTQGDYAQKTVYSENPVSMAKEFENAGIKKLHLVDLDGAKANKVVNHKVLEGICSATNLHVDFGGGLRSDEDIKIAFESGAKQITGGSIAVKNPDLFESWIEKYGAEKIILGADVLHEKIMVSGWQEDSAIDLYPFLEKYLKLGISDCICTDISKDGLLQGASFGLYKKMLERFPDLKLVASGGVAGLSDFEELSSLNLEGVIVGKAFYEGNISLEDLSIAQEKYLKK